nr:MAG TPA: hypothetical protein [Caudoviricetes sp.]
MRRHELEVSRLAVRRHVQGGLPVAARHHRRMIGGETP